MVYADLEIWLGPRAARGYPVELTCAPQVFATGSMSSDLLPWIASPSPRQDGERLFGMLFHDPDLLAGWSAASGYSAQRRIRLHIDAKAPELQCIPWELLCEPGAHAAAKTIAADTDTPFARLLRVNKPERGPAELPLRVLVAVASPADLATYGLDPVQVAIEESAVAAALQAAAAQAADDSARAPQALLARVDFVPQPVTAAAIEAHLGRGYHVLHIVAHGAVSAQGEPALFLADAANLTARISDRELAEIVERRDLLLRLVVLASCETASVASGDAFRGFAPQLIAAGVPAVVAMQGRVPQHVARLFGNTFYRQLLHHGQVDLAANEARSALISAGAEFSWAVPALFSRVPDGQLIVPLAAPPIVPPVAPDRRSWWERLRESTPAKVFSVLLAVLANVLLLIELADLVRPLCQPGGALRVICRLPGPPLPDRAFNIVVTEFVTLDSNGQRLATSPEARALSQALFASLDADVSLRSGAYPAYLRGPAAAEAPTGADRDALATGAAAAAGEHNATLLIYGVVTMQTGGPMLELAYHVNSASFSFGGEVAGSQRLGRPLAFGLPLDDPALTALNRPLKARIMALQRIVSGLKDYAIDEHDEALAKFRDAALIADWPAAEGKEVVHLLIGAALLRGDSVLVPPAERLVNLWQAEQAFNQARDLAPGYARSYLGLGSIALERADANWRLNTDAGRAALPALLDAARAAFEQARASPDQPPSAYVPLKASYGIGQAQFFGAEHGLPGWSYALARASFTEVIRAYMGSEADELKRLAGQAQIFLGEIAGKEGEWPAMVEAYQRGIELLTPPPTRMAKAYLAFYWTRLARAEEQRGRLSDALAAYDQALTIGAGAAPETDLRVWAARREQLWQRIKP